MSVEEMADYDYIIAGFHRWTRPKSFKDFYKFYWPAYKTYYRAPKAQEMVKNTDATIKMLEKYPVAIFPHINSGTHVDPEAVGEACAELGVFLELNVKHIIRNLGREKFEKLLDTKVKFIISTDAHRVEKIGKVDKVFEFIKPYNLDATRVVNIGDKTPEFRTVKNWR
jgi:putative hydrolase